MSQKPPIRWFRFFTLPMFLFAVSTTIVAAERSSSYLMFLAAGLSGLGVVSLLIGRFVINYPDHPAVPRTAQAPEHKHEHAIAHH